MKEGSAWVWARVRRRRRSLPRTQGLPSLALYHRPSGARAKETHSTSYRAGRRRGPGGQPRRGAPRERAPWECGCTWLHCGRSAVSALRLEASPHTITPSSPPLPMKAAVILGVSLTTCAAQTFGLSASRTAEPSSSPGGKSKCVAWVVAVGGAQRAVAEGAPHLSSPSHPSPHHSCVYDSQYGATYDLSFFASQINTVRVGGRGRPSQRSTRAGATVDTPTPHHPPAHRSGTRTTRATQLTRPTPSPTACATT